MTDPGTFRSYVLAAILTGGIAGCGSSVQAVDVSPPPAPAPVNIPAGVDSAVAIFADSMADESFVPLEMQDSSDQEIDRAILILERSDSIWLTFERLADSAATVSADDSAESARVASAGGMALVALDSLIRDANADSGTVVQRTSVLLDSAEAALEEAFRLNPFDSRNQLWLARIYELQARRLGRSQAYDRAIDELEKLTRLSPDQHTVFAMLANNHFQKGDWEKAALAYETAASVYEATFDLVADSAPAPDSTLLFSYARARADMHVRSLDAPAASIALDEALRWARAADDSLYVASEREWMAWDDGNIASSVARDSLGYLEDEGKLGDARRGYESLLATLTSRSAADEVHWRIAIVDYNLGNVDAAAVRLRELVDRTTLDRTGAATDSSYARYVRDYGTICLNLARIYLRERRDNRTALAYYEQASRVEWEGRAVAYLEKATLLRSNVSAALDAAGKALARENDLNRDQKMDLYRTLMGLYRRTGDFDHAREFRDAYRALRTR